MRQLAKLLSRASGSEGSNPSLSASRISCPFSNHPDFEAETFLSSAWAPSEEVLGRRAT